MNEAIKIVKNLIRELRKEKRQAHPDTYSVSWHVYKSAIETAEAILADLQKAALTPPAPGQEGVK
jgi:hypothetical protein